MLPEGVSGSDVVVLERDSATTCTIHLFGATVISWLQDGNECIFLSSKAKFDGKSAIRGGIPLVFPCFGPWTNGPQHGFARISRWTLESGPHKDKDGNVVAILSLIENEESYKMWNNRFKLTYTVTLTKDSLITDFKVRNNNEDDRDFTFTCLLHSYLQVDDITKVSVTNLTNLKYVDKTRDGALCTEERDCVIIDQFIDYTYMDTPDIHIVRGIAEGRSIQLTKYNLPDTVLWNPWHKASQMTDLDGYERMICLEAGHVNKPVQLARSGEYKCHQLLTVVNDK